MNSQNVLLLIAIGILFVVLLSFMCNEKFSYVNYQSAQNPTKLKINLTNNNNNNNTELETCTPADGNWIKPGTGITSPSQLQSPCCNPPDYKLPESYKTCANYPTEKNPQINKCLDDCCSYVNSQTEFSSTNPYGSYDTSWFPMARCACSLWCYNSKVSHFRKYGTPIHYISGDIAEAETPDTEDYIDPVTGGGL
jgi:hypothetical protein